jgi:serine/threonine-protein kinase PknK
VRTWRRTRTADAAAAPAWPAEQVPGYTDLHRIGHGGFSVVYRAHHAGLARIVALKVLTVEFIDARIRRGFLREVQLAGRLSGHPNVVTVLDSGMTSSGRPFIAMDYYERGSLRDRLAAEGPLPLSEVLRVGIKIAGALAAAHQEGILHRDIKPQNILMSRYGEPALADFGTARLTAELDASARTEALTPFHAAPEVLEGHPPGPAADVYSLGSTIYQLLNGRPAFQRDADVGIAPLLLRILTEELPPINRPDVPEQVSAVIHQAMHRDPARRYESAQALVSALRQQQQALGLQATETAGGLAWPQTRPRQHPEPGPEPGPRASPQAGPPPSLQPPPGLTPPGIVLPPIVATSWDNPEQTGYRPPAVGAPGAAVPGGEGHVAAPPAAVTPFVQGGRTAARDVTPDEITVPRRAPARPAQQTPWASGLDDRQPTGKPDAPPPAVPAATGQGGFRTVVAALAVAIPLLVVRQHAEKHGAAQAPSASAPTAAQGSSLAPGPTAGPAATPLDLTVQLLGSGTAGILRWGLLPGNKWPMVVQQVQPVGGSLVPLNIGTTSYTVTGLSTGIVYCFRIGTVTALGSQPQIAWSNTACTS